ncbi:hypothetical protein BVRB_6g146830 [Beta vulgaris subsp. vulgaris]|nr:hypothetical protein BVRB_6g146830 [Beta vulgaris subsp. vulgaris]
MLASRSSLLACSSLPLLALYSQTPPWSTGKERAIDALDRLHRLNTHNLEFGAS